nr:AlpA family phage regulatory protein [Pseudomonas syringae]
MPSTGFGESAIYEPVAKDDFPAPTKLGRFSRWSQNKVQSWIEKQKAARRLPKRSYARQPNTLTSVSSAFILRCMLPIA